MYARALRGIGPAGAQLLQDFPIYNSNPMLPWSTAPAGIDCSPMNSSNTAQALPMPTQWESSIRLDGIQRVEQLT
ncbi:hypothetical protein TNCV_2700471 [Trichonephila clavipes]|nr:hypothetical protein TNCV_2700471 [Trichonephila clavipes]